MLFREKASIRFSIYKVITMSKFTKLIKNPKLFFIDFLIKHNKNSNKKEVQQQTLDIKSKVISTTTSIIEKKTSESSMPLIRKLERSKIELPDWYAAYPTTELSSAINGELPVFLYIPWIAEHGNALISKIEDKTKFNLAPFDFVENIYNNEIRRNVSSFAREYPHFYRKMVLRRLIPLRNKISGVIFTFDWAPVMRIIASVCEELEIPTILIPHESVFVSKEKYYWDPKSYASLPIADFILGWGKLQKDIFIERGYPENRFKIVGAPKFDTYFNYKSLLNRKQFAQIYGFDPQKKIVLFASQPLDSQLNTKIARECQRSAIKDLLDLTELYNYQLLVRLPPSKDDILGEALRKQLETSLHASVDDANCYTTSPEEAIFHSALVTSVNSTMLFEAVLMKKAALSTKYVDFEQMWEQADIPAAKSKLELIEYLNLFLNTSDYKHSTEGLAWAAQMFGTGEFDGKACTRIKRELEKISTSSFNFRGSITARFFNKEVIDVIGIPSKSKVLDSTQKYLKQLLNARTVVSSVEAKELASLASVDLFFQWGISENAGKVDQRKAANALNRPIIYIEDGFIRSLDIGLSGEPTLSVILDDTTAYYDATKPSRLQKLLENGPNLTSEQTHRCHLAIERIVTSKVTKYNHAPDLSLNIGREGKRKILLIDQRFGDQSVISGLANENTFEKMLQDAINNNPDCDIIIKQHPDAIKGGKSSYYSNDRISFTQYVKNVFTVNFDINPYSLLKLVDEVYVVTSGMGFEALMAGKKVHCYGAPFYAGWGITIDRLAIEGRTRKRELEEIFYFAYIESSRYFDPDKDSVVELEELLDFILKHRNW